MFKINKEEIELEGKKITLETGKIARQADGAIIATCGETVVIATVVGAKKVNEEIVTSLKKFSYLIRKALSKKVEMKFLPRVSFVSDKSFDYAEKIEKLIQKNK